MSRVVYVNGLYKRYDQALVHAEDRGFQFADAVYEVIEVNGGCLVDATRHLDRLERSLGEIGMLPPMSRASLLTVIGNVVRRNGVYDGLVYLQVSRGAGPRDFAFPSNGRPTVVVIARRQSRSAFLAKAAKGISIVTMPDIRWRRCDIKTVMLLPACLAKNAAAAKGAGEAWFVDEKGLVTEGASSNAWIVTEDGALVTRHLDERILGGITRATLKDVAAAEGLTIVERPFTPSEARRAREAFITSATNTVMPVVAIDGDPVGAGKPGHIAEKLRLSFHHGAEFLDA
jgi:D-alanine transaminase